MGHAVILAATAEPPREVEVVVTGPPLLLPGREVEVEDDSGTVFRDSIEVEVDAGSSNESLNTPDHCIQAKEGTTIDALSNFNFDALPPPASLGEGPDSSVPVTAA